jgi:hypothetical protein
LASGSDATAQGTRRLSPRRLLAGVLLLVAAAVEAVCAIQPWWMVSSTFPSGSSWTRFYPGTSYLMDSPLGRGYAGYAGGGIGSVGGLYEAILYLLVILAVFAAIAGVLALVAGLGRAAGPNTQATVLRLAALEVGIGSATVLLPLLLQPTLIARDNPAGECQDFTSGGSFCKAFWGHGAIGSTSLTWGPELGWYLLFAALAALVVALVLWRAARGDPWPQVPPEEEAATPDAPGASSPAQSPEPTGERSPGTE